MVGQLFFVLYRTKDGSHLLQIMLYVVIKCKLGMDYCFGLSGGVHDGKFN